MGELVNRLRRVSVTSRSPGEAVAVELADGALTARIGRGGVAGHTEKSFAAEVEAAVAGALRGYGTATRRIHTGLGGTAEPPSGAGSAAAVPFAAVSVTGASPQNLVLVTRGGAGAVAVRICPGTLRRLRDDQLESHVNAALAAASQQLLRALTRELAAENEGVSR